MKISDIRASLQRLAERLDNQWAYARSDAEMDIAAGRRREAAYRAGDQLLRYDCSV